MKMRYLLMDEVLYVHTAMIAEYGGTHGLRDVGLLESAVQRPQQTFGAKDLYPTVWLKAAALYHSLTLNHAFVDGNKRTAITATALFLRWNGWQLTADSEILFRFILRVIRQKISVERIATWLEAQSEAAERDRYEQSHARKNSK